MKTIVIENGFQGEFPRFPADYMPHGTAELRYADVWFYVRGTIRPPEIEQAYYTVSPEKGFTEYKKISREEFTFGKNERQGAMYYCISEQGPAVLQTVVTADPSTNQAITVNRAYLNLYGPDGTLRSTEAGYYFKEMTTALISNNLTAYVDFAGARCSFDSPRFISVLQYLNTLPQSNTYTAATGENAILGVYEERVAMRQDRGWLDTVSQIGCFRDLMELRGKFGGEEPVFPGMPSDGGGILSLNSSSTFSITADSPV